MEIQNIPKKFMADFHCRRCQDVRRNISDEYILYHDNLADSYHLYIPAEGDDGAQSAIDKSGLTPHIISRYGYKNNTVFYHAHCAVVGCGVKMPGLFYSRDGKESSYYLFSMHNNIQVIADNLKMLQDQSLVNREERIQKNLALLEESTSFIKRILDDQVIFHPTEAREMSLQNHIAMLRHGAMDLQNHALVF